MTELIERSISREVVGVRILRREDAREERILLSIPKQHLAANVRKWRHCT